MNKRTFLFKNQTISLLNDRNKAKEWLYRKKEQKETKNMGRKTIQLIKSNNLYAESMKEGKQLFVEKKRKKTKSQRRKREWNKEKEDNFNL